MTTIAEDGRTVTVSLRWRDLDHQGHVYHATVLTLLDEARTSWLQNTVGVTSPDSYVVARVEIDYVDEIRIDQRRIDVRFDVIRIGRTSITVGEVVTGPAGEVTVRAVVTAVLWDRELRQPRPLEPAERERLEAFVAATEVADA
jgi:acyl-CoA thioester hydrolase